MSHRLPNDVANPGEAALDVVERAVNQLATRDRAVAVQQEVGKPTRANEVEIQQRLTDQLQAALADEHQGTIDRLDAEERALVDAVIADRAGELTAALVEEAQDPVLDTNRYRTELALAFIRGRLDIERNADEEKEDVVSAGRTAELSLHKFKINDGLPRVRRVIGELRGFDPDTLLDLGSGRGVFLWPLLSEFTELSVTAVDALDYRVRDIEAVRHGGVDRVHGVVADICDLPFDDGAFDIVTALEVLEHLETPQQAATEAWRVSRRAVIASVPSHEDNNPEHIQLFDADALRALFLNAGAQQVQIDYVRGHIVAVAT